MIDMIEGRKKMNSSNKEIMARNIKFYLNQKNITVKDFSKQLGFKYSTVLDWVHANTYPRIDKIEAMANYFNIDKSDLVEEHKKIDSKLTATDLTNPILAFNGRPIVGDQAQKIRDFAKFLLQEEDKNKNGDGE